MGRVKVLVVDDDEAIRFGVCDFLRSRGFEIEEACDCGGAREALNASRPGAVVLDYWLPDGNALELLSRVREIDPEIPAVILTGYGSIDGAVRAIKEGAENYLTKPVDLPALAGILERALEDRNRSRRPGAGKDRQGRAHPDSFFCKSAAMGRLAEQARRVLPSESPVLIEGESGVGKGVLATWLHKHGPRAGAVFVDINCAGLSREFLETEIFGHEKGAFTGAASSKPGLLEVADQGTVFLDEIGDMDLTVQAKLLKVLEEKRFRRLGEVRDRRVDVRLIAATHQDLRRLVSEGRFREDLYFRISAIPLVVPALRERLEDIPILAAHFLEVCAANLSRSKVRLSPDAEQALLAYSWPGNVRELRNVLERAVLLCDSDVIHRRDLRLDSRLVAGNGHFNANVTLAELERRHIQKVLAEENGHVQRAASQLGIPRSTLYQKIKDLSIAPNRLQTAPRS